MTTMPKSTLGMLKKETRSSFFLFLALGMLGTMGEIPWRLEA